MGAAPMGGNNSAGSTMVAGGVGTLSRPTFGGGLSTSGGSSTIVGGGGGTGLSTGFQTTQPAFSGLSSSRSSYNGETLVAGGYQPPAASVTQTPAIPLPSAGIIPRQPNNTPLGGSDMSGGITPPVPNAPGERR